MIIKMKLRLYLMLMQVNKNLFKILKNNYINQIPNLKIRKINLIKN